MRIETTYIADDDTEFSTEEECLEYEDEFKQLMSSVQFFDDNFITRNTLEDIEYDAIYVYIRDSKKAKKLFDRLYTLISFEPPSYVSYKSGDILWYTDNGEWVNVNAEINLLTTVRDTILSGTSAKDISVTDKTGEKSCPPNTPCPMDGFQSDCEYLWTDKCPYN